MKNKIRAISVAPSAMPPNPKIAAIIAITIKIIVQRNILVVFMISIHQIYTQHTLSKLRLIIFN